MGNEETRDKATGLYVAYGSNLLEERMRMHCPSARKVGTTELHDLALAFRGSRFGGCLTVEPHEGGTVPAGVWEVPVDEQEALDRYEGVPFLYRRQDVTVTVTPLGGGEPHEADAFMHVLREGEPVADPPSAYLKVCQQGYEEWGFDTGDLNEAAHTAHWDEWNRHQEAWERRWASREKTHLKPAPKRRKIHGRKGKR